MYMSIICRMATVVSISEADEELTVVICLLRCTVLKNCSEIEHVEEKDRCVFWMSINRRECTVDRDGYGFYDFVVYSRTDKTRVKSCV